MDMNICPYPRIRIAGWVGDSCLIRNIVNSVQIPVRTSIELNSKLGMRWSSDTDSLAVILFDFDLIVLF